MADASLIDSYLTDQFYLDMQQRSRTEDYILHAERAVIRERLPAIEQEMLKQMQSLEGGNLERLKDAISLYKAALSPIRNIPVEILCHIFEEASGHNSYVTHIDNPPWTLKHTCKRWHDIALSHPILWSQVNINLQRDTRTPTVALLETFLGHSGTYPLSVKLIWKVTKDTPEGWVNVIAALVEHSSHWKHFTLRYDQYFAAAGTNFTGFLALQGVKGKLPLLETLWVGGDDSFDFTEALEEAFSEAPALQTLEMHGWGKVAEAALPWLQLRKVRVEAATADDFLDILKQTPNIINCAQIRDNGDSYYPQVPYERHPITLYHLEQLQVINGMILDYITTPALHSLTLRAPSRAIAFLPRFFQRSNCQLTVLDLSVTHPTNCEQVISILKHTSTLKSLALNFIDQSDAHPVMAELSLTESRLLPRLGSLKLAVQDPMPYNSTLADFRSRLRKIDPKLFSSLRTYFSVLESEGVEIRVATQCPPSRR